MYSAEDIDEEALMEAFDQDMDPITSSKHEKTRQNGQNATQTRSTVDVTKLKPSYPSLDERFDSSNSISITSVSKQATDSSSKIQYPAMNFSNRTESESSAMDVEKEWFNQFINIDIPEEHARRYAIGFRLHGVTLETQLSDKDLLDAGISNIEHRDKILSLFINENDELKECWKEVFIEAGFTEHDAEMYAKGFSVNNIDDTNAGQVNDQQLEAHGIHNAEHRRLILKLIASLLHGGAELSSSSSVPTPSIPVKTAVDTTTNNDDQIDVQPIITTDPQPIQTSITNEEIEQTEHSLEHEIEKIETMERQIAKILAGDTDRQRALRERLAKQRVDRMVRRESRRVAYKLRQAERHQQQYT